MHLDRPAEVGAARIPFDANALQTQGRLNVQQLREDSQDLDRRREAGRLD